MPRGDGTGPKGQGAGTGKGIGRGSSGQGRGVGFAAGPGVIIASVPNVVKKPHIRWVPPVMSKNVQNTALP